MFFFYYNNLENGVYCMSNLLYDSMNVSLLYNKFVIV